MPQEIRSLENMILDVAYRKHRAGQARFGRAVAESEAPRNVYMQACSTIAQAFVPDGFRFAHSGPHFTRCSKDLGFKISFQSSHNNVAGEYVSLVVYWSVTSRHLQKWRATNHSFHGSYDVFARGQVGYLDSHPSYLEWNLADIDTRDNEIENVINTIRRLIIPHFIQFEDPVRICEKLQEGEVEGMGLIDKFDFVACYSSLSAARRVIAKYFIQWPSLIDEYTRDGSEVYAGRFASLYAFTTYRRTCCVVSSICSR
jgi:hypothetical protein